MKATLRLRDPGHWNTVALDGSMPDDDLLDLIDHSCELVLSRLPRTQRDKLNT
jgi:predicted DNA-binding protein (MmcQ/YjbR family)